MKKFTLFLGALLISMVSMAAEATISFADVANRKTLTDNQQVWEQNGLIVTGNKSASTTNVADYSNPARFYQGSSLTIKCTLGNITKIVIDGNTAKPVEAIQTSIGEEATIDGNIVTVIPKNQTSDTYVIEKFSAQVRINAITVTYTGNGETPDDGGETPDDDGETPDDDQDGEGLWLLVTDASDLVAGDQIVVAASEANVALSTNQKSNNRGQVDITKNGLSLVINDDVQVITLEAGTKTGTYAFNVGNGYLYAASSSSNHLKTETTLSDNSSWAITITDEGVASVVAQGENTRNVMQYNETSTLFACYSSASQKPIALYKKTNSEGVVLAPAISGETNFLENTTVTITAEEGLEVYYTLDGTDPTKASNKYTAPFELTATTIVKAIAYNDDKASAVVCKTFTKTPLIGCAEVNALANGEIAYMKPFDVVYVVEGAGYIYIKDETGNALIYSYDWDESTYFTPGDHVEGFIGKSSPYNGLPELKPNCNYEDLTITKGGTPTEPTILTEVPEAADVHKYVQFNGVKFKEDATFAKDKATNATMLVAETEVVLRNAFKFETALMANKQYNVVGFVALYNDAVQVYFLKAEALSTAVDNITIDQNAVKFIENGQLVIVKDGVRYNAIGQVTK